MTASRQPTYPAALQRPDGHDTTPLLFTAQRFRVERVTQPCRDGSLRHREVVIHPGAVVVVPMVTADTVCLVEVLRVSVGETLLELPAGTLEEHEPPVAAAARELTEETGYRANAIEPAGELWMSPGILRERVYLFVARGLNAGEQALEPGELIEPRVVPWSEAVAMCLDGRIHDAKSVAGILLCETRRQNSQRLTPH